MIRGPSQAKAHFKKLVRYIARHRLGSVELDIKNSFFQLLNPCDSTGWDAATTVSFTLKPSMATEERAVDGLKTRIS